MKGENYLLPVNFSVLQNYPVDRLQAKLEKARPALNIIVLDACRDLGGLAAMGAGPETVILFSAAPGQQTSEDPFAPVDLFTKSLAEALRGPAQKVRNLFYGIQRQVNENSAFKQLPVISETVSGSSSFFGAAPLSSLEPYRVGEGVTAPTLISQVPPEYSAEARDAKINGTVLLQVVVDANGDVRSAKVICSVGMGLDEKTIEAVKQWKFKPGTKYGNPVAVTANIEVNFRI